MLWLVLFLALGAFAWPGYAAPDVTSVSSASCSPDPVFVSNTTNCTVVITDDNAGSNGSPNGTFSVSASGGSLTNAVVTLDSPGANQTTLTFDFTPTNYGSGSRTYTVNFNSSDTAKWTNIVNYTFNSSVSRRTTTTTISCTPTAIVVDEATSCTVTVTDTASENQSSPTGTITIGQTAGSGTSTSCVLASSGSNTSSCMTDYTPSDSGDRQVTATYPDGNVHGTSSGNSATITVTKRVSQTVVECSETPLPVNAPTQCTVTVSDISPGKTSASTGDVTFSSSVTVPTDATFSSTTCTLVAVGSPASNQTSQCSVTYTPKNADTTTHTIMASYPGDTKFDASSDTFDQVIQLRRVEMKVTCLPLTLFIFQTSTCTVDVSDGTTAGTPITPSGSVDFDDGGKVGTFSAASCTLASGVCSVTYTPAADDAGTGSANTTITGTYVPATAPSEHDASEKIQVLTVLKRTTSTTVACQNSVPAQDTVFVNETGSCKVTVTDVAEAGTTTAPTGAISFSVTSSTANPPTMSGCTLASAGLDPLGRAKSECSSPFLRTLLPGLSNFAIDVVNATYAPDTTPAAKNIHAPSGGGNAQVVSRRTTDNTVNCDSSGNCTATVSEAASVRGPAVTISGRIEDAVSPNTVRCASLATNPCSFTVSVTSIAQNVTVQYVPDDNIHVLSVGGFNIESPNAVATTPSGQKDIWATQSALGTACFVANLASIFLGQIGTLVGLLPDPQTGGGFLFEIGVTIPAAELAAYAFALPASILAEFSLTACTDTDGDGLFNVVENLAIGTDKNNKDSDGDAMTDGSEIDNALGLFGGTPAACPSPLNPDSDADGVMDGSELSYPVPTSPCADDSEGDGLKDGVERASSQAPTLANGFYVSTPPGATSTLEATATWPGAAAPTYSSLTFPFTDTRLQSNPQEVDTDGDGIPDGTEFGHSCTLISGTTLGSFVNDDDSDDDGYQDFPDNAADVGSAGVGLVLANDGELGSDTTPSVCDPDSDGDGIQDGTEVNQGTDQLDWDSDDDGLSDKEELQTYFTDPHLPDTDGDSADGQIAFRDAALSPALSGYAGALNSILCTSDCEESLSGTSYPPFGNPLDETDPLQKDTDGDGIQDNVEFIPGCNATNTNSGLALVDGYANSFDSDGDGASDGIEGGATAPGAALADFNLATAGDVSGAAGNNGELNDDTITNICDPDADGDGLLDGEELGKGGLSYLDWDTDNDGLSDHEELITYFTDPTLADTDGDTADGVITFRDPTFSDAAHPALTGHPDTGPVSIACLSDCEEVFSGTRLFNPAFPATVPAPGLSGFGDPRDETDPLQIDTDGDGINDNIEFNPGCNQGAGGPGTGTALFDGFANSFDSDADGLRDLEDAVADVFDGAPGNNDTPVTRSWTTYPEPTTPAGPVLPGGTKGVGDGVNDGEINDDAITGICDPDSDGDGILDGEEYQIGTDPYDHDTDDDGRGDGEFLGQGPIPSDPLDFDTDDDGIGDGVEVFATNTTNPVNADTDGDGLCDGGKTTPASGGPGTLTGGTPVDGAGTNGLCVTGVAGHPNNNSNGSGTPVGYGEDVNGDGAQGASETNPNDFDSDDDTIGDGVEVLAYTTPRAIPKTDLFGRAILVQYPQQAHTFTGVLGAGPAGFYSGTFSCLNPLDADTDDDGLNDGVEDINQDGNFDFEPGDFDHAGQGPIPGPAQDNPEETNPCDPDSDHDGLNDFKERNQPNLPPGSTTAPQSFAPFNPTNPLDHDTDNDYMLDGEEVSYICPAAPQVANLDNDGDGAIDEDGFDGIDNDGDGKIDEDPVDFTVFHVNFLDPTNRDTDGDGWIDGLDPDGFGGPCNTATIVVVPPLSTIGAVVDTDGDGFADDDEVAAGTDPNDPNDHPTAFYADLDLSTHSAVISEPVVNTDGSEASGDDRMWLEDVDHDGVAESVVIDLHGDLLVDARVQIVQPRDFQVGDFDGDGTADDHRYLVVYAFANGQFLHPRILAIVDDYDGDGTIDRVELSIP